MDINFYKFKRNFTFKHDLKLLDGGEYLKSSASVTEQGDDGDIADIELSERQDEKVNLLYDVDVKLSDISNQDDFASSESIYRVKSRKVTTHLNAVDYGDDGDIPTLKLDKNVGLRDDDGNALEPEFTEIPLKPAHEFMEDEVTQLNVLISRITTYTSRGNVFVELGDDIGIDYNKNSIDDRGLVGEITISGTDVDVLNGTWVIEYNKPGYFVIADEELATYIRNVGQQQYNPNTLHFSIEVSTGQVDNFTIRGGDRSVLIDREMFATAGLWTSSNYDLDMDKNKVDKDNRSPYAMSKKNFERRLSSIQETLAQDGIDVVATRFTEKFIQLSDDELVELTGEEIPPHNDIDELTRTHPYIKVELDEDTGSYNYFDDIHYSFIDRYKSDDNNFMNIVSNFGAGLPFSFGSKKIERSRFSDSIEASSQFIERMNDRDELLPLPSDEVSPFDCSIKEIVMAIVGTADELFAELNAIYDSVDKYLSTSTGMFSFFGIDKPDNDRVDRDAVVADNYKMVSDMSSGVMTGLVSGISINPNTLVADTLSMTSGESLRELNNRFGTLMSKAKWFEKYAGESIMPDGKSVDGGDSVAKTNYHRRMARFLIPVDMGSKTIKKKIDFPFGQRTVSVKKDMGVRWVEVKFINASVYTQYRPNEIISGVENTGLSLSVESVDSILRDDGYRYARVVLNEPQYIAKKDTTVVIDMYNQNGTGLFGGIWKQVDVIDEKTLEFKIPWTIRQLLDLNVITPETLFISRIITPYPPTQESGERTPIQISYNLPHLPHDDEIRNAAFNSYGPFDQSANAVNWSEFKKYNDITTNVGDKLVYESMFNDQEANSRTPGYEVFKATSKAISDMRHGIGIYDKVQFLVKVLEDEFGPSRVKLTETNRSLEDQNVLQLGGPVSNFLSWHNYGLSVKIVITETNGRTPILDGTDDAFRLLNIAEALYNAAINGLIGQPCNLVWGGQLVTGPDLFVWEFLPVGVGHKDAVTFRDSIYNQIDPVDANAFVNVSDLGYLVSSPPVNRIVVPSDWGSLISSLDGYVSDVNSMESPSDALVTLVDEYTLMKGYYSESSVSDYKELRRIYREFANQFKESVPYVLENNTKVLDEAKVINGDYWVSPKAINNFPIEKDLVLKDIQEFMYLVRRKFDANGTSLIPDQTVMAWKLGNPISYRQLLLFNALIGSFDVCRSLISSDYVTLFENLIGIAERDPVQFVKRFLGLREYRDIKLFREGSDADGAYVSLYDGKLSVPILQCRSSHPHIHGNLFGEKQLDFDHVEFGQISNGVFTPEYNEDGTKNELTHIKSLESVVDGFDLNGNVIPFEGVTDVDGEFKPASDALWIHIVLKDKIVEEYKRIKSSFDDLKTNFLHDVFADSPNSDKLLENEFGIISTQDLMTFDQLRDMYRSILINRSTDGAGNINGVGLIDNDADGLTPEDSALLGREDRNRDQSIYEKLISTTQLTGIQFSRLTKEKPEIEPLETNRLEDVIKDLGGDTTPDVTDIL